MTKPSVSYTNEELETLIVMHEEGNNAARIAEALDKPVASVRNRLYTITRRSLEKRVKIVRKCIGALCRDKKDRTFTATHKGQYLCPKCGTYANTQRSNME